MASDKPQIPVSSFTVDVSVIDSTMVMSNVPGYFDMDPVYPGFETVQVPGYSFFIEHAASGRRLLFDLGLRKDFATAFNPGYVDDLLNETKLQLSVQSDVPEALRVNGIALESVEAVVLSHHHFDHIGNPGLFPAATKLLVGPGFKDPGAGLIPGYPADPEARETVSDAFEGRVVKEVDFANTELKIGAFRAFDYFGDGSFYVLATPGHTHSHLSALARTTAPSGGDGESTFIFIGGDIVHHCPLFRPSPGLPLPEIVQLNSDGREIPFPTKRVAGMHRLFDGRDNFAAPARTQPFCLTTVHHAEPVNLQLAATGLARFDAMDNVMVMFAHDSSLLGVVDFFPSKVTQWKSRGWKEECHWKFLQKFRI